MLRPGLLNSTQTMNRFLLFTVASVVYFSASVASESNPLFGVPGLAGNQCFKSFSGYLETPSNRSLFHFYHEANF